MRNFEGCSTPGGALGKQANLNELEIAALGGSLIGMGVDAESAGTAIRNMILNLASGSEATAGFRDALGQLGLDAEDVAQRLQTDGIGVILDIFERLREQAPAVRLALLQGLFDRRAAQSLAPLVTGLEVLERNLDVVADKANFAGRANEEYARRAETTAQKVREFKAAVEELGIIGRPTVAPISARATISIALIWSRAGLHGADRLTKSERLTDIEPSASLLGAFFLAFVGWPRPRGR